MKVDDYPNISVVICTRDRGSAVIGTVTSVLQNGYPVYEVLVIDQNRDNTAVKSHF
jgi:glycosyltransferase involved in cell wall biosynthesis